MTQVTGTLKAPRKEYAPGDSIGGKYSLLRLLGEGGMGSVWVAENMALKANVALKLIRADVAESSANERFLSEARLAARLQHAAIVRVFDFGKTEHDEPYIVMELLEGHDLATHLKRARRLALHEVAVIVQQTCRVLARAHRLEIIHRDIKPSNIFLVDTEGELFVKLLDFGVAKMGGNDVEGLTTTGAMVGTMAYMSPEQLLNARRVDHRADLWSLAVVAYRCITGTLPFKDDDGLGAFFQALEQVTFLRPSQVVGGLPAALDDFFDRAFQKDPSQRFASAREMVEEFFVAVGESTVVMPLSTFRVPLLSSAGEDPV
jgi:serine/threonine protein kinase